MAIPMIDREMLELQRNLEVVEKRMDDFKATHSGKTLTPAEDQQWLDMCEELRKAQRAIGASLKKSGVPI